tara:strand:+ start:18220 stop:19149 length:930 start_codon:yes stop_codon:yes gene_type:complete
MDKELDVKLDEFKSDDGVSSVEDPTSTKAKKRKGDDTSEKEAQDSVDAPPGGKGENAHSKRKADKKTNMGEAIDEIFEGEDLSEEFKLRAGVIFETVVNQKVQEHMTVLEETFETQMNENVETVVDDLTENLDSYLNYIVEKWMVENEQSIDNSIKTEICESFISGLRDLFVEHKIDVPDDEVDIVTEMAEELESVTDKLNEQTHQAIELQRELDKNATDNVFVEVSEGMVDTQVEKFRSLVEGLEFVDIDDYKTKIEIVKENYFNKSESKVSNSDSLEDLVEVDDDSTNYVDPVVAMYAKNITDTLRK